MPVVRDFRGIPITPNSIIVYPGRQSSTIWMNCARVLSITGDGTLRCTLLYTSSDRGPRDWRPVHITQLRRVAVVERGDEERPT